MDVRHASFMVPEYFALARKHKVATVFADSDEYPSFADLTGDFVYARLMRTQPEVDTGYSGKALDAWAKAATAWAERRRTGRAAQGRAPAPAPKKARDVFMYFISGAKERAPAAAMALLERLGR